MQTRRDARPNAPPAAPSAAGRNPLAGTRPPGYFTRTTMYANVKTANTAEKANAIWYARAGAAAVAETTVIANTIVDVPSDAHA